MCYPLVSTGYSRWNAWIYILNINKQFPNISKTFKVFQITPLLTDNLTIRFKKEVYLKIKCSKCLQFVLYSSTTVIQSLALRVHKFFGCFSVPLNFSCVTELFKVDLKSVQMGYGNQVAAFSSSCSNSRCNNDTYKATVTSTNSTMWM